MLRVCDEDFSRILVSYFQYQRKFRDSTLTKICGCFIYTFICVIQTAASLFATRCNKVQQGCSGKHVADFRVSCSGSYRLKVMSEVILKKRKAVSKWNMEKVLNIL